MIIRLLFVPLFFLIILVVCFNVEPSYAKSVTTIEQLIEKHGKRKLMDFVLAKRNGSISISYPGNPVISDFGGMPSRDLIDYRTLAKDLKILGKSASQVDALLSEDKVAEPEESGDGEWNDVNERWSRLIYAQFDPGFLKACRRNESESYCRCVLDYIHENASGVDIENLDKYLTYRERGYSSYLREEGLNVTKARNLISSVRRHARNCGEPESEDFVGSGTAGRALNY